ncbi:hypothetical protein [Wenzhouxiangella marina]|uniref:hypothetical protein n=1 Tax=Wenzhouxiangella marina TaxID=1579979 RepID=UPI0012E16B26|nr:hypothetical protein [Wenzhouxiangella marina]MBB6086720.1 hypothetical protein [Wenzhouxiangella marina]
MALLISPSTPATPPVDAVPFYCAATVEPGSEALLECRRSDTRELIPVVPPGLFLFITDVMTQPASEAVEGVFTASFGRDQQGSDFPGTPSLDLIGHPFQMLNFTTPYVILAEGEALAVANSAQSDFAIEVRASGYLSGTFVEPPPAVIFLDRFEETQD